ncbi:MAG: insulinase family protein [Lachnospirales bacterium]
MYKEVKSTVVEDGVVNTYKYESNFKVIHYKNSDENRVFTMSIKTPCENNRGIPHVLEHLVLCGSEKYPIRDPFNELLKSSLYTYLNAITYKDRTIYPVASKNKKEFEKLTKVYLDAIFNPLLPRSAFLEEGVSFNGEFNGIAYNEMKSVYKNPDDVLIGIANEKIFKSSIYEFDSGGIPEDMESLEYNDLAIYYNTYYNESNMICYFYGDIDIDYYLNFIEDNYLKGELGKIVNIDMPQIYNGIYEEKINLETNYKYSYDFYFVLNSLNHYKIINEITLILDYLFANNTSYGKKIFMDNYKIVDFTYDLDTDSIYPIASISLKSDKSYNIKDMYAFFMEKLELMELDKEALTIVADTIKYYIKEEDFGYKPRGLGYFVEFIKLWNYNDFTLNINKNFDFEPNLEGVFKDNLFKENVTLIKSEFYNKKIEKLEKVEGKKTEQISNENFYKDFTFNVLNRNEVTYNKSLNMVKDGNILIFDTKQDVVYLTLIYKNINVCWEYLGLLIDLYKEVPTKNYTLRELERKIDETFVELDIGFEVFRDKEFGNSIIVESKLKKYNLCSAIELIEEIIKSSTITLEDINKRKDEILVDLHREIQSNSDILVVKTLSSIKDKYLIKDRVEGINYYNFIKNNKKEFDDAKKALNNIIMTIKNCEKKLILGFDLDLIDKFNLSLINNNYLEEKNIKKIDFFSTNLEKKWYNCNDYKLLGKASNVYNNCLVYKLNREIFDGSALVLANLLSNDYLNENLRIKNGAYDYDFHIDRDGFIYTTSIYDNYIKESLNIMRDVLKEDINKYTSRDIDKHVVGTINNMNLSKNSYSNYIENVHKFLNGVTSMDIEKTFKEVINTNKELLINKLMEINESIVYEHNLTIGL